jgi:G:T-mismatch repair DNA endonuclease (very short patch repair protein)
MKHGEENVRSFTIILVVLIVGLFWSQIRCKKGSNIGSDTDWHCEGLKKAIQIFHKLHYMVMVLQKILYSEFANMKN